MKIRAIAHKQRESTRTPLRALQDLVELWHAQPPFRCGLVNSPPLFVSKSAVSPPLALDPRPQYDGIDSRFDSPILFIIRAARSAGLNMKLWQ